MQNTVKYICKQRNSRIFLLPIKVGWNLMLCIAIYVTNIILRNSQDGKKIYILLTYLIIIALLKILHTMKYENTCLYNSICINNYPMLKHMRIKEVYY